MNTHTASVFFARGAVIRAVALAICFQFGLANPIRAADSADNLGTLGRVVNFSGLTNIPAGGIFTYGFVVGEGAPKTLLIRAAGPSLSGFGVSGPLSQPVITLFSGSRVVATNTGWTTAANAADIRATAGRSGAFAFADNTRDSALLVTLDPGNYTVQVSGAANTSGMALVEVYDVDAKNRVEANNDRMLADGQRIFRDDTFGSEAFWGGQLRLHQAVAGAALGGVGPGLSAKQALDLGLKVDVERVPQAVASALRAGQVDLNQPQATIDLLKADAVVGLKAFSQGGQVTSVGITCAICHSTVDNSFSAGIGRRLDGWPNRDLDIGAIVALAPTLKPFADLLQLDENTVRSVFRSWGPGKYDAILDKDGKATRPDGKSGATVLPAAFGLAGQHLHTYTGWGSVPYWNAYVAVTQMHGQGIFYDPRLRDATKFPVAARAGLWNIRAQTDMVTSKLPALQAYQLSLMPPEPPANSFNPAAASRGQTIFNGKAKCATCHVPPLYSEPGQALHRGSEIGIDDFQANRSPENAYRTTPLRGLFVREKGGFYHDGRFIDLDAVINHYKPVLGFDLTTAEQSDLVQFLKSL